MKPSSPLQTHDLRQLAALMAGEFDNLVQARAEPTWYVPLTVWQRPISTFPNSFTLFMEQANQTVHQRPYRQRVLRLQRTPDGRIRGQYYALREPDRYWGGGQDPDRLKSLQSDELELLPQCWVTVAIAPTQPDLPCKFEDRKFEARPEEQCTFSYRNQTICIELGFDIYRTQGTTYLLSYEKGINPETNQAVWGALMGPFHLIKRQDFPLLGYRLSPEQ
mgnify:CR=1 FL=1